MAELTADREGAWEREGVFYTYPQQQSTAIYAGALVVLDADGYAEPATAAQGKVPVGVCVEQSINGGADGAVSVKVKRGVFRFNSQTGDEPADTDVGKLAYAYSDNEVGVTPGLRSAVGTIVRVEGDNTVWVEIKDAQGLVNARRYALTLSQIDLDDEAALRIFHLPVPMAGRITKIITATSGAITAGADAVLTFSVNATAITGGVVTIASGSAVGTIDSATPTAFNAVTQADHIKVVITGAQTADAVASITVVVDY